MSEPWRVTTVAETGSTNADLMALALAGAPDRSVLVAGHQTAGRGRLDRRWDAPAGQNLLCSILLRGDADPHRAVRCVGLAARTSARSFGVIATLKWPNDLLADGAKVAGILAERCGTTEHPSTVVGIGVNLGWAPVGAERIRGATPVEFLARMLESLGDELDRPDHLDRYRTALATLDQIVRVEQVSGTLIGRAVAIDGTGALIVEVNGNRHTVTTGDVVHLRPIDGA